MNTDATQPATRRGRTAADSVANLLHGLDHDLTVGEATLEPAPLGMPILDRVLGGGLQPGDLLLLGGGPGVGKTVLAMQWARHLATSGRTAIYVCYEHEVEELLLRLLALELGERHRGLEGPDVEWLRSAFVRASQERIPLAEALSGDERALSAYERVRLYAPRLWFVSASGAHTGLDELREHVLAHGEGEVVLFVDYLQKVAVRPEPPDESEKVTRIVEGLKDIALDHRIPVVSVVAADREGIKARRTRLHHLRGSSALQFESDVALVLNEKFDAVSNVHLQYDPVRADTFREWVVFSVEKNRGGPTLVDVEFRKQFRHYRFDPDGGLVREKLIDERVYSE